jgi:hypothetical protein
MRITGQIITMMIMLASAIIVSSATANAQTYYNSKTIVRKDWQISRSTGGVHPNRIDSIYPKDYKTNKGVIALVAIHGGGGTKHEYACRIS